MIYSRNFSKPSISFRVYRQMRLKIVNPQKTNQRKGKTDPMATRNGISIIIH